VPDFPSQSSFPDQIEWHCQIKASPKSGEERMLAMLQTPRMFRLGFATLPSFLLMQRLASLQASLKVVAQEQEILEKQSPTVQESLLMQLFPILSLHHLPGCFPRLNEERSKSS
jgi:hypothetical protein